VVPDRAAYCNHVLEYGATCTWSECSQPVDLQISSGTCICTEEVLIFERRSLERNNVYKVVMLHIRPPRTTNTLAPRPPLLNRSKQPNKAWPHSHIQTNPSIPRTASSASLFTLSRTPNSQAQAPGTSSSTQPQSTASPQYSAPPPQ